MSVYGVLKSWSTEQHFGYIQPSEGGAEVLVQISAFPRDGLSPEVGEFLTFVPGVDLQGRIIAERVGRVTANREGRVKHGNTSSSLNMTKVVGVSLGFVLIGAAVAYLPFKSGNSQAADSKESAVSMSVAEEPKSLPQRFTCDQRKQCSQMRSCAEAKFFLKSCKATGMDKDRDGVPCEEHWC